MSRSNFYAKANLAAVALMICWVLFSSQQALAKSVFVNPNGSDANNGSTSKPFKTLAKACDVAVARDVIILAPGVFQEQRACNLKSGVTLQGVLIRDAQRKPQMNGSTVVYNPSLSSKACGSDPGVNEALFDLKARRTSESPICI
jgi:hypothetical protein